MIYDGRVLQVNFWGSILEDRAAILDGTFIGNYPTHLYRFKFVNTIESTFEAIG